jgi:predicted RNA binding protein YcfA (HicA-like mRNA interferase family)
LCKYLRTKAPLISSPETDTRKIIDRLLREGWVKEHGGNHDKFRKPGHKLLVVPRHRTLSLGVARGIAKDAGW